MVNYEFFIYLNKNVYLNNFYKQMNLKKLNVIL